MDDQKITYFGLTNFRNQERRFGIKQIDRRKHMYIVGKTGMGKTTLLENLAMQDIQNGEGLAFIDPHGETAYKLLDFVPQHRINDVVYFDPADTAFPVGFNIMENVDPERRHFVASGLMSVFKKIFGPDVWSARMEYILSNTVLALLEYPHSTLLSINPMLAVKDFRKKVVENITDPVVKAFWTQEFAKYTERFAAEATPAIQNKVGQFTSNPLIRNIVGQTSSTFNIRKLMDQKKILIVNLAKGRVGEDTARLLGAMIVTKLYLAAMSRVDILEEQERSDFFLYVDEFQNFATESFANILSEARKYRLDLILAHQYMAQLAEEVRDAVVGNVGTMLAFRVGADDAEFLEKEFGPEFMATDMVNLGFAQIYLKLMIDGVASRPFSALTLPPIANKERSYRKEILDASQKNYGASRASIEKQIGQWAEEMSGNETPKESAESKGKFSEMRQQQNSTMPLFEAVCVVCGKKTTVPFQPDPTRPVFCKEHMGLAAKYPKRLVPEQLEPQDKIMPKQERISPPIQRILKESVFVKKEERASPYALSLQSLLGRSKEDYLKQKEAQVAQKKEKQDHLAALRHALKKTQNTQTIPEDTKQPVRDTSKGGILRPGESIKL